MLPYPMRGSVDQVRCIILCAVIAGSAIIPSGPGAAMDTPAYLRSVVTTLAREIGVRTWRDLDRLERTVQYVSAEYAAAGLAVSTQSFTYDGKTYRNVIGELKGRRSPEKVLVVG